MPRCSDTPTHLGHLIVEVSNSSQARVSAETSANKFGLIWGLAAYF